MSYTRWNNRNDEDNSVTVALEPGITLTTSERFNPVKTFKISEMSDEAIEKYNLSRYEKQFAEYEEQPPLSWQEMRRLKQRQWIR